MSDDSSVFPLVLAIKSDGSVDQVADQFEANIGGAAQRASAGLGAVGKSLRDARREAEQKVVDPLGIRASINALSTSSVQRIFDTYASGSAKAASAQQQMRAETVAAINAQQQAALTSIRQQQAARTAAFTQAQREVEALASLERQRAAEMARTVAAPSQQGPSLYFDPQGSRQAATAAQQQAAALRLVAAAAEEVAADTARATSSDRAFAVQARETATAATLEATRLLGLAETHARVGVAAQRGGELINRSGALVQSSAGAQRAGFQQLGFQLNDVAVQYAAGTSASIIFAQQSGQVIQAIQLINGGAKGFVGFLSGPWGLALTTAFVALTPFVAKILEGSDALGKEGESLRENAAKAGIAEQAKAAFANTEAGVIDDVRALTKEIKDQNEALRTNAERLNIRAKSRLEALTDFRSDVQGDLADARSRLSNAQAALGDTKGVGGSNAARQQELAAARTAVAELEARLGRVTAAIGLAQTAVLRSRVELADEAAKRQNDPAAAIEYQYEGAGGIIALAKKRAIAEGVVGKALTDQLDVLRAQKELDKQRAQDAASAARRAVTENATRSTYSQFISPVNGPITSPFGARAAPKPGASSFHPAIDFGVPVGTPVQAPAVGTVKAVGFDPKLGKFVIIDHGGGTTSRYGHLSQVDVAVGQRVGQGDVFARSGNTGLSTGPHLDYQIREGGKAVDPRKGRFRTDEYAAAADATKAQERAAAAARATVEAQQRLENATARAGERVAAITGQFDEQPRLIDRAKLAMLELAQTIKQATDQQAKYDELIARLQTTKPAGFEEQITQLEASKAALGQVIEQAQAAGPIVQDGLLRPYRELLRDQDQQLAVGRLILQGRQDEAETLQQIYRLEADMGPLTQAQADAVRRRVTALKEQGIELERQKALIDLQVQAARQLQSAVTDFLTEPFAKGALSGFQDALTKSRRQQVADTLGLQLFGGDLGSQVYRALTNNNAPTVEAADRHIAAAGKWDALADRFGGLIGNDNTPSALQQATTPTAFGFPSIGFSGTSLEALQTFAGATSSGLGQVGSLSSGLFNVGRSLTSVSGDLGKQEDVARQRLTREQAVTMALSYAAQAIGGKGGRAIDAALNAKNLSDLGKKISDGVKGSLKSRAGDAVAGLGIGQAVGSVYDLLGIKGTGTGSALGGAIGGAAFGPLGAIGGSILGGLIGNAFYKPKFGTANITSVGGAASVSGRGSAQTEAATGLAKSVQDGIQQVADQLGGKLGAFNTSIGVYKDQFRVSTTGYSGGKLNFKGTSANGLYDFGTDQAAAIKFAIADAVADGAILGLRQSTQRLLQSGKDIDRQLQKALQFENIFTELKQLKDPVGAAIDAIEKQFNGLRDIAKEAGADTAELAQLEELYGIKRVQAIKEAQAAATGQLQSLLADLKYKGDTGLSLRTRDQAATAALSPLIAEIMAGKTVDQDQFTDIARSFLDIKRLLFGSTDPYFKALTQITDLTGKAIANTGVTNIPTITGTSEPGAAAAATQTSFTIPEDRVAMMTAGQLSSAVGSGVADGLAESFRLQTTALLSGLNLLTQKVASLELATGGSSGLSQISALRNA